MAWTATLRDAGFRKGRWVFYVTYSDGADVVTREYFRDELSDEIVRATARAEVAGLQRASASAGKLSLQPGDAIDLAAPAEKAQSQGETKAAEYVSDLQLAAAFKRAVDLGIMDKDDARVVEVTARLRANWRDEYMGVV